MATIVTRLIKGGPLTNGELDANLINLNNDIATRVPNALYVGSEILSRLLTVDGVGSGLDANFLGGLINNNVLPSTPDKSSIVARDVNGDFAARIITANLVGDVNGSASRLGGQLPAYYTDIISRLGFTPANVISPSFSGIPTAPTAAGSTNNDQIATTKFVKDITGNLGNMSQQNNNNVVVTGGNINGVSVLTIGTNATGAKYVSTLAPSGGVDGDIWYRII